MFTPRKKQRGQHRELKALFANIDKFTPFNNSEEDYKHFHVPGGMFIEHAKTYSKIKTAFCKKWIETTEKMIVQKPEMLHFCKIVAVISVPHFWSSQIIIFYDESYYKSFWNRDTEYQMWLPITNKKRSFVKERNISTLLCEYGYHEKIQDEDELYEEDLWFYGELPYFR